MVVGAINVDLVVSTARLPGPGETVVGPRLERHGGGKGANAAVAAARAGAQVRLVGAVGADDNGSAALAELQAAGVDVGGVAVLDGEPTGVALIVVDRNGENQIAVGGGANAAVTASWVHDALRAVLPQTDCVLVSTEIPDDAVIAAVEAASALGVACILNPAPPSPAVVGLLALGPTLTPNLSECTELAGMLTRSAGTPACAGHSSPDSSDESGAEGRELGRAAARAVMARSGAPVVVTLGGAGALLLTPAGGAVQVPPTPTSVRDTTGAGDTFNGVLASRIAAGDQLPGAVWTATVAASLSVAQPGARGGMPSKEDILAALKAADVPAPPKGHGR